MNVPSPLTWIVGFDDTDVDLWDVAGISDWQRDVKALKAHYFLYDD
jgi:hypothetical protein